MKELFFLLLQLSLKNVINCVQSDASGKNVLSCISWSLDANQNEGGFR